MWGTQFVRSILQGSRDAMDLYHIVPVTVTEAGNNMLFAGLSYPESLICTTCHLYSVPGVASGTKILSLGGRPSSHFLFLIFGELLRVDHQRLHCRANHIQTWLLHPNYLLAS